MLRNSHSGPALAAFSIMFPVGLAVGLAVLHLRSHSGSAHSPFWEPRSSRGLGRTAGLAGKPEPVWVETARRPEAVREVAWGPTPEQVAAWLASVAALPELLDDWVTFRSPAPGAASVELAPVEPVAVPDSADASAATALVLAAPLARPAPPRSSLASQAQQPPEPTQLGPAVALPASWGSSWADDIDISGFLSTSAGYYPVQSATGDRESSGVSINDVRLIVQGGPPAARVYLSLEAVSPPDGGYFIKHGEPNDLRILDGYASVALGEHVRLVAGQFISPVLFTAQVQSNELLFLDRTINGFIFQERDTGVMALDDQGRWQWWLAVQNGRDSSGDDVAATARLAWRVFGEGEAPRREGAYDADLGHTLYVGGVYFVDGTNTGDQAFGGEAYYTFERLAFSGEFMHYGDDLIGQTFWNLTAAWMLSPEEWELAARYEDFDLRAGEVYRIGLNRYLGGLTTRVQANVARFQGQSDDESANAFEIGLTASF